jgi:hypothetical protein
MCSLHVNYSSPVYEELWLYEGLNILILWERNMNTVESFVVKRKTDSVSTKAD